LREAVDASGAVEVPAILREDVADKVDEATAPSCGSPSLFLLDFSEFFVAPFPGKGFNRERSDDGDMISTRRIQVNDNDSSKKRERWG